MSNKNCNTFLVHSHCSHRLSILKTLNTNLTFSSLYFVETSCDQGLKCALLAHSWPPWSWSRHTPRTPPTGWRGSVTSSDCGHVWVPAQIRWCAPMHQQLDPQPPVCREGSRWTTSRSTRTINSRAQQVELLHDTGACHDWFVLLIFFHHLHSFLYTSLSSFLVWTSY